MRDWLTFTIAALAVYRVSRMIADEEGPWGVFTWLRAQPTPQTWLARGLECPMCVSFWVALPTAAWVCMLGYADLYLWPLVWMALSSVTVIIRKWEQKR
jgi:hypothetical protein